MGLGLIFKKSIYLSEITRMVFIPIYPMVVHATGVSSTSGMLAVFSNTTMSMGYVSSQAASLLLGGSLKSTYFKNRTVTFQIYPKILAKSQ